MKKTFLLISLSVPVILVANFVSVLSNKSNNPIVFWESKFVEEKISPGETSEINIIFESKKDLQNIELWLTPELKDFITFTPEHFNDVHIGAKNFIHLGISIPEETPFGVYEGVLHVKLGERTIPQTLKIILDIVEPPSEENLTIMLETHKEAVENFKEWLGIFGREEARRMTVDWLRMQSDVQEIGISDDGTIWILFTNGIEGNIGTYPSGTLGRNEENNLISPIFSSSIQEVINQINTMIFSEPANQSITILNQPTIVGNNKVIILDPFFDGLNGKSPQSYVYSKISPLTDATYLKNKEVTVEVTENIYKYGVISITTHGRLHRNVVSFLSGEKVTPINIISHIGDLRNKRLSIGWQDSVPYYEILPTFITNYAKESYSKSLVYIGACQSLKNLTMANAFLNRGAATYLGFTKTTSALFNKEKAEELFINLIDKRGTTIEAFTNGSDSYWPGSDPEYGYEFEPAKFEMAGESNLILLLPPSLVKSLWPVFQHDLQHSGQSLYGGAETSRVKWVSSLLGGWPTLQPTVGAEGVVYVNLAGRLYAFNQNGSIRWDYGGGAGYRSGTAIGLNETIYIVIQDYLRRRGELHAISSNGSQKWVIPIDFSSEAVTPTVDLDGIIYVTAGSKFYSINSDGSIKWVFVHPGQFLGVPAIGVGGVIYHSLHYNYADYLIAVDVSGNLKWEQKLPFEVSMAKSFISIDSNSVIYIGTRKGFYAFNSDGSQKWVYQSSWEDPFGCVAIGGKDIYVTTSRGLHVFYPDGATKWTYFIEGVRPYLTCPIIDIENNIYFSTYKILIALNSDGTLKWDYKLEEEDFNWYWYSIASQGILYVISSDGGHSRLHALGD